MKAMIPKRLYRLAIVIVPPSRHGWSKSRHIPAGYYNTLDGKSGQALKDAIHNLTKQHTMLSYGSLWIYFTETDCQAHDDATRCGTCIVITPTTLEAEAMAHTA